MGRLIDAYEFLNSERERCNGEPIVGTCTQNNQYLMDVIKKAKTVEAEPVRHGKWLKRNTSEMQETFVCCSICGYPVSYHWRGNENFCPNCGAKMDVE